MKDCLITGNESAGAGGGIAYADGDITNCTITNNKGTLGGGVAGGWGDIIGGTISGNIALKGKGGGVYGWRGDIDDVTISDNDVVSVSVEAPSCVLADGLATALMIVGPGAVGEIRDRFADADLRILFLLRRGEAGEVEAVGHGWDR